MWNKKDRYIKLRDKFYIAHFVALSWLGLSIFLSIGWVKDLSEFVSIYLSILIIAGIAYIPGYINAFNIVSLLLDKQPKLKVFDPEEPITILIACHNEEKSIGTTLEYIANQSYKGDIKIIVIDNNSTDRTAQVAKQIGENLGLDIIVIVETKKGKHNALNTALTIVDTKYMITLDADTLLMKDSIKNLMSRQLSSPDDVVATAGAVLTRNSRKNFWTKIQEWDYFLGIASVKRMQGMYGGTLVAQGAYSVYKTEQLREIGGYPDVIGEDIVITWLLLEKGYSVYFEPLAVAFTDVPETFNHLQKQRSRWARGMIEALKMIKPWQHKKSFVKYATGLNMLMPFIDVIYTFVWIPGVILAFFGYPYIAGILTLLVLPLALIQSYILYLYQSRNVFEVLKLKIRKNKLGFIFYILFYQIIMSPISIYGYMEEVLKVRRVWK